VLTPVANVEKRSWSLVVACLALAVLVTVVAYVLVRQKLYPSADERQVRNAVQAVAAYLAATVLRGDDAWIATQGALKLGPDFRTWAETLAVATMVEEDLKRDPLTSQMGGGVEGHLWNLRWLPELPAPSLPPPDLEALHPVSTALSDEDILAILQVMAHAVACRRLSDTQRRAWMEELSTPRHSYLLTHQLIALMLGYNQDCIDEATAEPLRQKQATQLWIEQAMDQSGIHDLSIERMAALCYAQVCNWLRDEWVNELIKQQEPSGSWGERNPQVNPRVVAREEHGAALGFYVLAAFWQERFGDASPPVPPPVR
jgi:hypothetical protein